MIQDTLLFHDLITYYFSVFNQKLDGVRSPGKMNDVLTRPHSPGGFSRTYVYFAEPNSDDQREERKDPVFFTGFATATFFCGDFFGDCTFPTGDLT